MARPFWIRRLLPLAMLVIAGVALAVVVRNGRPREVVPGAVRRSSQPDRAALEREVRDSGVRSVVNLRGAATEAAWYREEREAVESLGIASWNLRVKLDEAPPRSEVLALLRILEDAPRPVLLHCRAGADRAGWASAFARAWHGEPLRAALSELSVLEGHLCRASRCPLHAFFREYERWLAETGEEQSAAAFRRWAADVYCPEPYDAELEVLDGPPPRSLVAPGAPIAMRVRVTNRSRSTWELPAGDRGLRLGVREMGPFPEYPEDAAALYRIPGAPGARDRFGTGAGTGPIRPGESRDFDVALPAPAEPGRYVLQIDMVDEVHWFTDLGRPGIMLPIEVAPGAVPTPERPGSVRVL